MAGPKRTLAGDRNGQLGANTSPRPPDVGAAMSALSCYPLLEPPPSRPAAREHPGPDRATYPAILIDAGGGSLAIGPFLDEGYAASSGRERAVEVGASHRISAFDVA